MLKEHKEKVNSYRGKNYAVIEYWNGEITRMEQEREDTEKKLEKK